MYIKFLDSNLPQLCREKMPYLTNLLRMNSWPPEEKNEFLKSYFNHQVNGKLKYSESDFKSAYSKDQAIEVRANYAKFCLAK